MIPCHICGTDASTGWITGFVPAPDSQKLALCAGHDTPENRAIVSKVWEERQRSEIAAVSDIARHKAAPDEANLVTVHFSGGGMLSFTCTSCAPTEQGTLRIEETDGTQTFVPMQHVREYTVRPVGKKKE